MLLGCRCTAESRVFATCSAYLRTAVCARALALGPRKSADSLKLLQFASADISERGYAIRNDYRLRRRRDHNFHGNNSLDFNLNRNNPLDFDRHFDDLGHDFYSRLDLDICAARADGNSEQQTCDRDR